MRTKIILTTTLLAALLAVVAVAQPGGGPWHRGGGVPWETLAADYDQNQDGQITLEEFGNAKGTFAHFDHNGDGVLTADDFGGRMRMRPFLGGFIVRAADADDDGAVTAAEWQTFLGALDADADGLVSEDELRATLHPPEGPRGERPRGARGPRGDGPWAAGAHPLDRDGDGTVEVEDLNLLFAALDADGDGTVAADELPMPPHRHRG